MKLLTFCVCIAFVPSTFSKKTYQITIPNSESFPYAKLQGTIDHPLVDFTLCHWSRVNAEQQWGAIFSYAVGTDYNSLLVMTNHSETISLWRSEHISLTITTGVEKSEWLHTCTTWVSITKKWEIFVNGVKKASGKGNVAVGTKVVHPNGVVILGQEQDSLGGSFDANQTHIGQISDLNLWDHILSSEEIYKIYTCTSEEEANVINWNLHSWELFNGARISMVSLPCGTKK